MHEVAAVAESRFRCPACRGPLTRAGDSLACAACARSYAVEGDVPDFVGNRDEFYEGRFAQTMSEGIGGQRWARTPIGAAVNALWRRVSIAARRQRLIQRHLPEAGEILDLACGGGTGALVGAGEVTGVDLSWSSVRQARRVYAAAACADASALPFPEAAFDVVFSSDFLGHVPEASKDAVLSEVRRCLRPGGRFVFIAETDSRSPLVSAAKKHADLYQQKFVEEIGGHYGLELPSALTARLRRLGFAPVSVSKMWLCPAGFYVRMLGGPYESRALRFRLLATTARLCCVRPIARHATDCLTGLMEDLLNPLVPFDWGMGVCGVYRREG
jgi:SAM-dependent methyltransferase